MIFRTAFDKIYHREHPRASEGKDLPPKSTLYDYFDLWTSDGTLENIQIRFCKALRRWRISRAGLSKGFGQSASAPRNRNRQSAGSRQRTSRFSHTLGCRTHLRLAQPLSSFHVDRHRFSSGLKADIPRRPRSEGLDTRMIRHQLPRIALRIPVLALMKLHHGRVASAKGSANRAASCIINDRVHGNIQKDGTFSVMKRAGPSRRRKRQT
jgi:hypothetical protein